LRHGESENNKLDRVNGWTDSALTEYGREQANTAARKLREQEEEIGLVVTSPLARARVTSEIVAEILGADLRVVEGLRERCWGVLENGPRAALTDYFMVPEGGESWEEYRDRVWQAISVLELPARSLLVGHAGTMRVLRDRLGIGDVTDRLPNAAPVRFERSKAGTWRYVPIME
jgi:probable phosphoglycerate mutase